MQNYADLGIVPALVLCMHTFHGMQAYIHPSDWNNVIPSSPRAKLCKWHYRRGKGGNTQISSKNFKIVCKLLCPQVPQPLDIFFWNTACPLQNIEQKAIEIWVSTIYQPWNFTSIMHWLVVVLRVRLDINSLKGWEKWREKKPQPNTFTFQDIIG